MSERKSLKKNVIQGNENGNYQSELGIILIRLF